MAYSLPFKSSDQVVELGGGSQPMFHPNVDIRKETGVDIVADLSKPLPIPNGNYDGLFSKYALEHVSWRVMPDLVKESFRILRSSGTAVFVIPNTKAQMEWALRQDDDSYDKVAQCLFGDLDYAENSHQAAFSPAYAIRVFREAGFDEVAVIPHGELKTDMIVEARKNMADITVAATASIAGTTPAEPKKDDHHSKAASWTPEERKKAYDRQYFDGGGPVGGYAREGYWDYPVHWTTFQKVMEEKPESVLEIGCARGYVLKRLEDAGVRVAGLEVSEHCYHTRAVENVKTWDVIQTPWPFKDKEFDLCFSAAVLEHIPENAIDAIAKEMARVSKRGMHGVDYGEHDDGFDKTHCTFHPPDWWRQKLGPDQKIVDKEDLEKGAPPLPASDGKLKINVGSFTTMLHYGWTNIDIHPLHDFAKKFGFAYQQHDARHGMPYASGAVDMIYASHFVEHLTYEEGVSFLKECHRTLTPGGYLRLIVPDAKKLIQMYVDGKLGAFDELNAGASKSPYQAGKLWNLLFSGHSAMYDNTTMLGALREAGFKDPSEKRFRESGSPQMLRETVDMLPTLSLYVEAVK